MLIAFISLAYGLIAQDTDRKINFPDVEGYKSLKCDLHIHTVFSDGSVWPNIRVEEAVRDGLDAIALTEHIEYQPHKDDIPHPDRNRSYHLALEAAKPHDLLIIHGTEITRSMPPGHANALFVKDVNTIKKEDAMDAYKAARAQGAYIFWNHPDWIRQQKDALPVLSDFHKQLIANDLLHGIEVVNDLSMSEAALQLAVDHNLTAMGTSDIHGLVDYAYEIANGGHRPICLVFAKEKTEEAIKEALFAGRTVAWFRQTLLGKKENMKALLDACLKTKIKGYEGDTSILEIELRNNSDAAFILENSSVYDFRQHGKIIEVAPQSKILIQVVTARGNIDAQPLTFKVLNAIINHKEFAEISIALK